MIGRDFYATFPWYDFAEMHAVNDALWSAVARELLRRGIVDVPGALDRGSSHTCDHDAACLFTQTCGYPLLTTARDRFTVVGVPRYRVPGCTGPLHRSFVVVRDDARVRTLDDLRATCFAINEADSNSGMNLPRRLFAPLARDGRFFARTIVSGSHAASAMLVTGGGADAAALDCVTFALFERYRPAAVRRLRIVAETPASPAPPLVTSRATDAATVEALRRAVVDVGRKPEYAHVRDHLLLAGIDPCNADAYRVVLEYEREAVQLGYPELR